MDLNLRHFGYSKALIPADGVYEGRPRITSMTPQLNGGVYCPPGMEKMMEAIVVDFEKDKGLKAYLEEMDKYVQGVILNLQKAGRKMDFSEIIKTISHKITADFPYSDRMLDRAYQLKNYQPGQKIHLGALMKKQDMVCRHMGLLMGAAIDYFKMKFANDESGLKFKPDTEIRFMADMQSDLVERERSGHAFLVVRKPRVGRSSNDVLVVDPSSGRVIEIGGLMEYKGPWGPAYYRYVFSAVRFMLQAKNSADEKLLERVFLRGKTDPTLLQVLKDVNKNLRTPEAISNYIALLARLNLKGLFLS